MLDQRNGTFEIFASVRVVWEHLIWLGNMKLADIHQGHNFAISYLEIGSSLVSLMLILFHFGTPVTLAESWLKRISKEWWPFLLVLKWTWRTEGSRLSPGYAAGDDLQRLEFEASHKGPAQSKYSIVALILSCNVFFFICLFFYSLCIVWLPNHIEL